MTKTNKQNLQSLGDGWGISTLGEFVAKRSKGIAPKKTPGAIFELYSVPSLATGSPEIVKGNDIGSNKQIVHEGTVLLCKINPRINRTWVVSPHSTHQKIASTEWITFPPSEVFDPKYLAYYLKQDVIRDFLAANASGVGGSLMRVKPATIKDYPIPIPPLEQQKRIVAEIEKQFSRLDEAVANLKRVKANLKRYKAAILKAAVEGNLTEKWRKQHLPAPTSQLGKFYTYAILCEDDSIYIGHTSDIERRWKEHREGNGAEWTKNHKPTKIAHYEEYDTREEAAKREKELKTGYGRKWIKRELAAGRTRQAGDVEPASKLLERILDERRQKWEEAELAKSKAPKADKWKKKYKVVPKIKAGEIDQLPELPDSWAYIRLGEVIEEPKYGTSKKCDYETKGTGVLRIPNVVNGFVDSSDLKFAEFDEKECHIYALAEGDILTIRSNGSVSLVGKYALIKKKDTKYLYAGYLIRLRPIESAVHSKYLANCFSSLLLRKQIEFKAKSTSGVNNINSGELQALILPICSKKEQEVILGEVESRLSVVACIERLLNTNLHRAECLRQSILSTAFSGQLINRNHFNGI